MTRPALAYVGLGANLGDPIDTLQRAIAEMAAWPSTVSCRSSSLYRTRPVDAQGPDFINGVVALQTTLAPLALLDALQALEQRHGRQRPYRNAPRTLDLDILYYDGLTLCNERLIVPHPRLHLRAFALVPLAELAPELRLAQGSVTDLRQKLDLDGLTRVTGG